MCSFSTVFHAVFHRRHLAQRSDECLQLHSTRYGKSRNLWTFTHVDLANFGIGRNSWRQCPTLYVVALFTIFQYISYILLDLFVPCSVFEWFQNPIMNTGYLQVLTPSETFGCCNMFPKTIAKDMKTFPLTSFRSLGVVLLFWQPFEPCRADFVSWDMALLTVPQTVQNDTGENYPIELWALYTRLAYFLCERCTANLDTSWYQETMVRRSRDTLISARRPSRRWSSMIALHRCIRWSGASWRVHWFTEKRSPAMTKWGHSLRLRNVFKKCLDLVPFSSFRYSLGPLAGEAMVSLGFVRQGSPQLDEEKKGTRHIWLHMARSW